jgi:hypothetical protein
MSTKSDSNLPLLANSTLGVGNTGTLGVGNTGTLGVGNTGTLGVGNTGTLGVGNTGTLGVGNTGTLGVGTLGVSTGDIGTLGNSDNGTLETDMEFLWGGRGWDDDESDFDTFGQQVSQSQMTHLQSEIARITVECQHWRELAQQRTHVGSS